MSKYVVLYFIIINLSSLGIMYIDKRKSRRHKWRIPESVLISFALFGGAIGTLVAMELYRHKTKHNKFKLGIPVLVVVNLILYYLVLSYII